MYSDIDEASQRDISASAFASTYRHALVTATATHTQLAGGPRSIAGGLVAVPVLVRTRLFGSLALRFAVKTVRGVEGLRVDWSRSLAFPGLRAGELLARRMTLPRRATLLARDGSVLAESPASSSAGASAEATRSSPLGDIATAVLGSLGPVPASRRVALEAQGVPPDASVGVSGLERALDDRLRGAAGGALLAQRPGGGLGRVLAYSAPRPAPPLHSTISPALQRAAVLALGGQLGGIVAMRPSSGQILAVAGLGLNGLQPPGSTFKMVTLTGVLEAHVATPHSTFPYASFATLDGVRLNNANGENCGGTLELAFAVSCNSVFAPLGVKLGPARLVATAERFGFNQDAGIEGAPESTLPAATMIVAATIADGGRRPRPAVLLAGAHAAAGRVMSAAAARTVRRLMSAVVRVGTGTSAAIPGVVVAGKTGTAELKTTCSSGTPESASGESGGEAGGERCRGGASDPSNTDAWFAAFAPAIHPRIAVCVMLVKDGAGGDTAAPVARQVLEAGLQGGSG
jgi:cell division protein FtsI/penicillin-binding protein 2